MMDSPKQCLHHVWTVVGVAMEVGILALRIGGSYLQLAWRLMTDALLPEWLVLGGRRRAKDVSGKTVLVTGAASGIGRHIALQFAGLGATLVLWDINQEGNEKTAEMVRAYGVEAFTYVCDVRLKSDVQKAASEVYSDVRGKVDILVNNAGVMVCKELLSLSEEEITCTMTTNSLAHFWTVQEFLPGMMENFYGHIVNVSSMSGIHGVAMVTDYSASKFAVVGFTEAVRDELRRYGLSDVIKTTVVCPYMVNTNLLASIRHRVVPRSRFDKVMEPEQVAQQIVEGVLRDESFICIPGKNRIMQLMKTLMPQKALDYVMDFAETGFFSVPAKQRQTGN